MLRSGLPTLPLPLLGCVVSPVRALVSAGILPPLRGLSTEGVLVRPSPWYKGLLAIMSLFNQPALGFGPLGSELVELKLRVRPAAAPPAAPAAAAGAAASNRDGSSGLVWPLGMLFMLSVFRFCRSELRALLFEAATPYSGCWL